MRKTKNFNIQVPELGDVPDITQVSNAIQDLEDALAGTLEIMDASIQGSGLTLSSVARQTKRTKYYDGMSMRFLCPQTIIANTLKTVVVDDLPQQVITVPFDIIAGEYVDITYRGTSFTAHPVMIQKSESTNSNSNETVATSKAVKKVNDKVNNEVSELNKNKVSKSGDTMTWMLDIDSNADRKVRALRNGEEKGSFCGFTNAVGIHSAQSGKAMKIYDDGNVEVLSNNFYIGTTQDKGITLTNENGRIEIFRNGFYGEGINFSSGTTGKRLFIGDDGLLHLDATNLKTKNKEVANAINELCEYNDDKHFMCYTPFYFTSQGDSFTLLDKSKNLVRARINRDGVYQVLMSSYQYKNEQIQIYLNEAEIARSALTTTADYFVGIALASIKCKSTDIIKIKSNITIDTEFSIVINRL